MHYLELVGHFDICTSNFWSTLSGNFLAYSQNDTLLFHQMAALLKKPSMKAKNIMPFFWNKTIPIQTATSVSTESLCAYCILISAHITCLIKYEKNKITMLSVELFFLTLIPFLIHLLKHKIWYCIITLSS